MIRTILIILAFCLIDTPFAADRTEEKSAVSVVARIDRSTVYIGDKIKYTIEVKTDKNVQIKFPEFGDNLAKFAIREFGSTEGGWFGKKTSTRWYLLDTYETGKFIIPGALIKYRKKGDKKWEDMLSNTVLVDVKSMLAKSGEKTDIRDIRGPVSIYNRMNFYMILSAVAIMMMIGLVVLLRKKRRKKTEAVIASIPAHEIAYNALQKLLKKDYLKSGKIPEYYFELSSIIRRYVENRFELKAPEMTTEEFLTALRDSIALNSTQKGLVREFLSHCDLVKFARYLPDEREIQASYESAERFITQTKAADLSPSLDGTRQTKGKP